MFGKKYIEEYLINPCNFYKIRYIGLAICPDEKSFLDFIVYLKIGKKKITIQGKTVSQSENLIVKEVKEYPIPKYNEKGIYLRPRNDEEALKFSIKEFKDVDYLMKECTYSPLHNVNVLYTEHFAITLEQHCTIGGPNDYDEKIEYSNFVKHLVEKK